MRLGPVLAGELPRVSCAGDRADPRRHSPAPLPARLAENGHPAAMTSILRLRGCPWSATEDDLRGFFEGFDVQACHLCLRNGEGCCTVIALGTGAAEAGGPLGGLGSRDGRII